MVTLEDLDAFAKGVPDEQRAGFFQSPERIETLLTNLLLQKQLAGEARAQGLDTNPASQRQLALAEEEALSRIRMQQFRADIKLPDFEQLAQEEFLAHREKYVIRGGIDAQHVLIAAKTRSEDDAKSLAEMVQAEAKAQPEQFDALVEKYSDDPSKSGNLGIMKNAGDSNTYLREFAEAASALKTVGEISPVIKTSYGFHVLKLVRRTSDVTPKFAEVKDAIVAKLRSDYVNKQIKTHTDTLRNLPIDANAELVSSLRARYGSGAAAGSHPAASK
jgi:peptidyl-prolyl cis-trans isomerase C